MIQRTMTNELLAAAQEYPVVTVFGPRQSGKTTLVQAVFPQKAYCSLEDPDRRLMAQKDPRGFLGGFKNGAILDEIQRIPELLSYLQTVVDHNPGAGRFILTGSHQPALHHAISQSLAGRTALMTLFPFSLAELSQYRRHYDVFELLIQGAFPRLHEHQLQPERFFNGYVQTYLERDVRSLIDLKDLHSFQRFLGLLAGRVGQLVNYASLANDTGVSPTTIKAWISVLTASFVIFELPPYFENIGKRLIKAPKIYFCDTGLAASLAGIRTAEQCVRDPMRGGLYENLVILEILKHYHHRGRRPDLFFYRDSHGNEVDLVIKQGRSLVPIEIKSAETFSDRFIDGIAKFRAVFGPRSRPGGVVYNGPDCPAYQDIPVLNLFSTSLFRWLPGEGGQV